MSAEKKSSKIEARPAPAPGTAIHLRLEQPPQPRVSAFIWGGKVRPVPALPYGRRTA